MKERLVELLPAFLSGDLRGQLLYVLSLGLLIIGTLLCLLALRFVLLDVLAAAVTCAGAVGWLLSNTAGQGGTLVVVLPGNGLTLADLAALPSGILVGYLVVRRLRTG